ncbi:toll/interleukin-1 receptor domain-containing protein [Dactylosporangium sp. NPDC049525]|uniref:toll/interleukin-1 receptor domain-containing protein n=1 Tax=Dactylosporangium sp. NPDC049525 TaxID=3154730 RepID=UPI003431BAED
MTGLARAGRHHSDVFISYRRDEQTRAERLATRLMDDGYVVWIDRDFLLPGTPWQPSIESAIRNTGVFVAMTSDAYQGSEPCKWEYDTAAAHHKFVVCVGEPAWNWKGWPKPVAAQATRDDDLEPARDVIVRRLPLGRRQARLFEAAATPDGPSFFRGERGSHEAGQTIAALREEGLSVPDDVLRFVRALRRRRWLVRSVAAVAVAVVTALLAVTVQHLAALDQATRGSEAKRDQQLRTRQSETLAAQSIDGVRGREDGAPAWSHSVEPLRLAAMAYDRMPTEASVRALRQTLAATPHVDDLWAYTLPAEVVATRLLPNGGMVALAADGSVLTVDHSDRSQTTKTHPGAKVSAGWISADGASVVTLSTQRELVRWSTSTGGLKEKFSTDVSFAAFDGTLSTYATAVARTVTVRGPAADGRIADRCQIRQPAAVMAMALTVEGDVIAVGDLGGRIVIYDAHTCEQRYSVSYPDAAYRGYSVIDLVVADAGRVVGFCTENFSGGARRGPDGEYTADGVRGPPNRSWLSPDGTAAYGPARDALGDPLGVATLADAGSVWMPGTGSERQRTVTAASLERDERGNWSIVLGTAGGSVFRQRLDRVMSAGRSAAGNAEQARLHPLGVVAGGLLVTSTDRPAQQPVDLLRWERSGAVARLTGPVASLAWKDGARWLTAPAGSAAALTYADHRTVIVADGGVVSELHPGGPVALTPSGGLLVSVAGNHIDRWNLTGGKAKALPSTKVIRQGGGAATTATAVAALEDRIIVGRSDGSVEVLDLTTGEARVTYDGLGGIRDIVVDPQTRQAVVLTDHALFLVESQILHVLAEHEINDGLHVQIAPGGRTIVVRSATTDAVYSSPNFHLIRERVRSDAPNDELGTTAIDQSTVVTPDGAIWTVCNVCATDDPAVLRAAAGRIIDADAIGSR